MRRKQYIDWLATVFGIVGVSYGGFMLLWHHNRGNGTNPLALTLLILGLVSLAFGLAMLLSRHIAAKKRKTDVALPPKEEVKEEAPDQEDESEEAIDDEEPGPEPKSYRERPDRSRPRPSGGYSSFSTAYVRLAGYGPLLRFDGTRVLDMRSNTYYRIEGDYVYEV